MVSMFAADMKICCGQQGGCVAVPNIIDQLESWGEHLQMEFNPTCET